MRSYESVIKELEEKNIFPYGGSYYFDFTSEDHPLKKQFEDLFRFGQDFLDRRDLEFQTDNARFFFSHRSAPKAYSQYTDGYFLIDFFRGLIESLDSFYSSREGVFSLPIFDSLKFTLERICITPKVFFLQSTSQLYFYHEATHFLQNYIEHVEKVPFPTEQKQKIRLPVQLIREFDADWYGAACVAVHAGEVAEEEAETIVELSIMSLSAFLLFWIERWDMNDMVIVNKERTHPHPLVRLTTWIVSLAASMMSVFGYVLDVRSALKQALEIAVIIEGGNEHSKSKQFVELMEKHHTTILAFVLEIQENAEHYPYAANNNR